MKMYQNRPDSAELQRSIGESMVKKMDEIIEDPEHRTLSIFYTEVDKKVWEFRIGVTIPPDENQERQKFLSLLSDSDRELFIYLTAGRGRGVGISFEERKALSNIINFGHSEDPTDVEFIEWTFHNSPWRPSTPWWNRVKKQNS